MSSLHVHSQAGVEIYLFILVLGTVNTENTVRSTDFVALHEALLLNQHILNGGKNDFAPDSFHVRNCTDAEH
jgi:hypothetical protein